MPQQVAFLLEHDHRRYKEPSKSPTTLIAIADKVKASDGKYDLGNFVAAPGDKYTIKAFNLSKTNSGQLPGSKDIQCR